MMTTRVKLVAIAKDEAAYLPDWIHHHLYFGFDSIDVYINNTSDNTTEFTQRLRDERVNFLDGDIFFKPEIQRPQDAAYTDAYNRYLDSEFTHLMFLDIDEFWTPLNFTDSIHDCLAEIDADVISFEWFIRQSEEETFSEPFPKSVLGVKNFLVKSIFSLKAEVTHINPHNVICKHANYKLADDSIAKYEGIDRAVVSHKALEGPLKKYFVLHRMFRSQMEYVSLLGRGRPKNTSHLASTFKNNRPGYCGMGNNLEFVLPTDALSNYNSNRAEFFDNHASQEYINEARSFVAKRFDLVNHMISNARAQEFDTLNQILKNVTIQPTANVYQNWLNRRLLDTDIDQLRDIAILCESFDMNLAYRLMSIARKARPQGHLINKKVAEYRRILKISNI